ncbi:hypothetical protein J3A83DRAFT_4084207 [Scleroderma citrinum]
MQTWKINITKLPSHLRRIIKAARTHNLSLDVIAFHPTLLQQALTWFHIGATSALNHLNNHTDTTCLREQHGVISVGEMANITKLSFNGNHCSSPYCQCTTCIQVRTSHNCLKPFKCVALERDILACLPPK